MSESASTTSGASAPDDKTATVQHKPATSLAGNNNMLAYYEQSRGYDQISHALSNIHGLYVWSCNLLDIISVYSLNQGKLPGYFSYERPGYKARVCLKRQEDFVICFSEEIYPHLHLDVGIIHPTTGSIMDNCGRSARSATICAGVEFDDLVTGRVGPSYTFRLTRIKSTCKQVESAQTYSQMDPEHTATTTKGDQDCDVLHKATDTLVKWVDDTIRDIEIQSGRKVVKFYVGKTFARQIKNRKFDAMNPNTWRKSGISSRWRHHKQEDYGRNGMVVLTVVTKDDVPQQSIPAFKHHEMYALALEQQLIIHYAFIRGDERLANTSTGMQQQEESRAIGYPIYMAFALDDNGTDLSDEVLESDVEECYIAINQGESLTGEETSVTELQDQRLTKKQEEAIVSASELSASLQETLQQAQNSSSSNERHIHFLNEDTICGIDSVPWDSPEPPVKEASSDDKIFSTDLIQPSTQPHK